MVFMVPGDGKIESEYATILAAFLTGDWKASICAGAVSYEQSGSHIQLKHPTKKGRITVPDHKGDLKKSTIHSIFKQAGLK